MLISPMKKNPMSLRLAVHQFESIETAPFDVTAYSRMKFGSDLAARAFGYEMADFFFERHHALLTSRPCVVTPAPSTTVPVAATLLSQHFTNRINARQALIDALPVEWTLIHRNMTYNNNYADLPKEERKKLLANDTIYINRGFVEGKFIIFIDDCTITGTHEEKIIDFLAEEELSNDHAFLCFAKYNGGDASIEMRLNHVAVRDAFDLVRLSREEGHRVTTRSLRLLLEYPEDKFEGLLDWAGERFIEDTFHCAIVKGYNRHPPYRANFNTLAKLVRGHHKGLAL